MWLQQAILYTHKPQVFCKYVFLWWAGWCQPSLGFFTETGKSHRLLSAEENLRSGVAGVKDILNLMLTEHISKSRREHPALVWYVSVIKHRKTTLAEKGFIWITHANHNWSLREARGGVQAGEEGDTAYRFASQDLLGICLRQSHYVTLDFLELTL